LDSFFRHEAEGGASREGEFSHSGNVEVGGGLENFLVEGLTLILVSDVEDEVDSFHVFGIPFPKSSKASRSSRDSKSKGNWGPQTFEIRNFPKGFSG
jgi:hypothetical protein